MARAVAAPVVLLYDNQFAHLSPSGFGFRLLGQLLSQVCPLVPSTVSSSVCFLAQFKQETLGTRTGQGSFLTLDFAFARRY